MGYKPDLDFDTVGLVIWPVKIVSEMTYNVLSGTLNLYTTTTDKTPKVDTWHASTVCWMPVYFLSEVNQ